MSIVRLMLTILGRVRGVLRAHVAVTSRALLATLGVTRIAAVLAETVSADGSKWYEPSEF